MTPQEFLNHYKNKGPKGSLFFKSKLTYKDKEAQRLILELCRNQSTGLTTTAETEKLVLTKRRIFLS